MEYRIAILVSGLGVDGVSHEAYKKKKVLEDMGYYVKIITGRKNHHPGGEIIEKRSLMDFKAETHELFEPVAFPYMRSSMLYSMFPNVKEIARPFQERLVNGELDKKTAGEIIDFCIRVVAAQHEKKLNFLLDNEKIDIIIPENTFSMPMQLPLAVALNNIIKERDFPTIAFYHDFYFERKRFKNSNIKKLLKECFPPMHKALRHVVLNSYQKKLLKNPKKIKYSPRPTRPIDAYILPNTFDYSFDPDKTYTDKVEVPFVPRKDSYNRDFRDQLGFNKDDILLLQNTRIVSRKNIEKSIDILLYLKQRRPEKAGRYKLVISLSAMDEGNKYYEKLIDYIRKKGLTIGRSTLSSNKSGDVVFTGERISSARKKLKGKKIYHYLDTFPNCDFCVYPSTYEGWGNVIGEATQAKIPLLINKYPIYKSDIKKYGFRFVEIMDKITKKTVDDVLKILEDPKEKKRMVEHNFKVGKEHLGLDKIRDLFMKIFKDEDLKELIRKRREAYAYMK